MTGAVYLRLPADLAGAGEGVAAWLDTRTRAGGEGSLTEAAGQIAGGRVVVLVPARDVVLLEAELPTRNRQQLLKALPYLVEEQFGADIESLHFATPARIDKGKATVAVVAKDKMRQWQEALAQAGITPNAMIPESLALPLADGEWSVLCDGGVAILRTGVRAASALPASKLELLLRLSLDRAAGEQPGRVRSFARSADAENEAVLRRQCEPADIELAVERTDSLLGLYAAGLDEESAIDLMQGEFARKDRFSRYWRPWRAAAALALVFVLLHSVAATYDYVELRRQDDDLRNRVERLYKDVFPQARNLVDPRLQMEQQLKALKRDDKQDEFLRLLADVGPVLRQAPSLELDAMSYRQRNLDFDFRVRDFQSLDELKAELVELDGLQVTVTTANAEAGRVRGQLRIQRVGS